MHWVVIHITHERWIVFKTDMPSQEWIVNAWGLNSTFWDHSSSQLSIRQIKVEVLIHTLMEARSFRCWPLTFVSSILVYSPHVLNSLLDLVLVSNFWHVSWHDQEKGDVMQLKLEKRRSHCDSCELVAYKSGGSNTSSEFNSFIS
jgi:hypothetical protein